MAVDGNQALPVLDNPAGTSIALRDSSHQLSAELLDSPDIVGGCQLVTFAQHEVASATMI